MRRFLSIWLWIIAILCFTAPVVSAAAPNPQHPLAFPTVQVLVFALGSLAPLVSYVINHYAPWASEHVKFVVQIIVAAIVGGVTQAIDAGSVGFNARTLQLVGSSVFAALVAHRVAWLPSGISLKLGGGTNAKPKPSQP